MTDLANKPLPMERLTRREREIVLAILDGCTNREMAIRFGVSEHTIRNQLTLIYLKADVSSRLELALAALGTGLAAGCSR